MDKDYESYNKNIEDFDARNIFEYETLKELNQKKFMQKNSKNQKQVRISLGDKKSQKEKRFYN